MLYFVTWVGIELIILDNANGKAIIRRIFEALREDFLGIRPRTLQI